MVIRYNQTTCQKNAKAFTLMEVVMCVLILSLIMVGVVYGYLQSNRIAEWGSMSLAAHAYASQSVDRVRAAKWDNGSTNSGPGTANELPASTKIYMETNIMLIAASGQPFYVTNYYSVTAIYTNPPLWQIRADCVWKFPLTGQFFTNTVITQRGPD